MNQSENRQVCLIEETVEITTELVKMICKSLRFSLDERNVLNPSGPSNRERIVAEMNDFAALVTVLEEEGIIPMNWMDSAAQAKKREKLQKFLEHSRKHGALDCPEVKHRMRFAAGEQLTPRSANSIEAGASNAETQREGSL